LLLFVAVVRTGRRRCADRPSDVAQPLIAADHLLTFRVSLLGERYTTAPSRVAFVSDLLAKLSGVPGVRDAAVSSIVPFSGVRNANAIEIEGRREAAGSRLIVDQRHVSPGYFAAMQIPRENIRLIVGSESPSLPASWR